MGGSSSSSCKEPLQQQQNQLPACTKPDDSAGSDDDHAGAGGRIIEPGARNYISDDGSLTLVLTDPFVERRTATLKRKGSNDEDVIGTWTASSSDEPRKPSSLIFNGAVHVVKNFDVNSLVVELNGADVKFTMTHATGAARER